MYSPEHCDPAEKAEKLYSFIELDYPQKYRKKLILLNKPFSIKE
jgi:hypothetical protein